MWSNVTNMGASYCLFRVSCGSLETMSLAKWLRIWRNRRHPSDHLSAATRASIEPWWQESVRNARAGLSGERRQGFPVSQGRIPFAPGDARAREHNKGLSDRVSRLSSRARQASGVQGQPMAVHRPTALNGLSRGSAPRGGELGHSRSSGKPEGCGGALTKTSAEAAHKRTRKNAAAFLEIGAFVGPPNLWTPAPSRRFRVTLSLLRTPRTLAQRALFPAGYLRSRSPWYCRKQQVIAEGSQLVHNARAKICVQERKASRSRFAISREATLVTDKGARCGQAPVNEHMSTQSDF